MTGRGLTDCYLYKETGIVEIREGFCPPKMSITRNLGNGVFPVSVSCSLSDEI